MMEAAATRLILDNGPLTPVEVAKKWNSESRINIPKEKWRRKMESSGMLTEDGSGRFHLTEEYEDGDG